MIIFIGLLIISRFCFFASAPLNPQVPVGNENQQVVQQQYQQQVMVPVSQAVQGPMPVYYSVITPTQQNSTRWASQAKLTAAVATMSRVSSPDSIVSDDCFCRAAHR